MYALAHLFNLRFAAKELQRNSKKCDKQEKEEKAKLVSALKVICYILLYSIL